LVIAKVLRLRGIGRKYTPTFYQNVKVFPQVLVLLESLEVVGRMPGDG